MREATGRAVLILLLSAAVAAASDLRDYQERLTEAAARIEETADDNEQVQSTIRYVKELVPKSEDVKTEDRIVKVDNSWLHRMLDEAASEVTARKRSQKLADIGQRLDSLAAQLEAADNLKSESKRAKERIAEILARPAFQTKPEDPATRYIREVKQKVANFVIDLLRRIFGLVGGSGSGAGSFFLFLIVVALGAAAIIAVRMLLQNRRPRARAKVRRVLGEEIDEGTTSGDLARAALATARTGDFRLAIRKLYISLLYELAERELIELEPDATNRDYLSKISRFGHLVAPMRYMTDRFDYIWYGMSNSSEDDFKEYLDRYNEAMGRALSLAQPSGTP